MRRSVQPSFPSAITCCFFSSFKTLLMPTERIRRSQCPERWFIVGRFSADNHWPVLGDRRGASQEEIALRQSLSHSPDGPRLGTHHDSDMWVSSVWGAGDSQRSRM